MFEGSLERFSFDWSKEWQRGIFKLTVIPEDRLLGLMSIAVISLEQRLDIRLLELSDENIGTNKEFDRVAGCLIAYACRESFRLGFDGFVSLMPKTKLVAHYIFKCGFVPLGRYLVVDGTASRTLIHEYLNQ
ncbi:hypothetical protein [Chitinophaga sp. HK235]|uniref:hypothetical protein n=1 Tax=Chitinophaga sp. HK235 TaxID=2952571 RepID=UPI001BA6FB17|nr:hypothetical protein [Chitinophaga sp. HK235]